MNRVRNSPSVWGPVPSSLMLAAGFTDSEADQWLAGVPLNDGTINVTHVALVAVSFRDAGWSVDGATLWKLPSIRHLRVALDPAMAAAWAEAGWEPSEVDALIAAAGVFESAWAIDDTDSPYPAWRDSGINAHWCVRYAAAGVNVDEAHQREARRRDGEDLTDELATLAALRS